MMKENEIIKRSCSIILKHIKPDCRIDYRIWQEVVNLYCAQNKNIIAHIKEFKNSYELFGINVVKTPRNLELICYRGTPITPS